MIKTNSSGEIVLFIQEPEDQVAAIRFIHAHRPGAKRRDYVMTKAQQARHLGLKGGYGTEVGFLLHQSMAEKEAYNMTTVN